MVVLQAIIRHQLGLQAHRVHDGPRKRSPKPSSAVCVALRAVYVGNYEYDASERELERTFEKYGPVDRVEYKSGMPARLAAPGVLQTTLETLAAAPRACRRATPPTPHQT